MLGDLELGRRFQELTRLSEITEGRPRRTQKGITTTSINVVTHLMEK